MGFFKDYLSYKTTDRDDWQQQQHCICQRCWRDVLQMIGVIWPLTTTTLYTARKKTCPLLHNKTWQKRWESNKQTWLYICAAGEWRVETWDSTLLNVLNADINLLGLRLEILRIWDLGKPGKGEGGRGKGEGEKGGWSVGVGRNEIRRRSGFSIFLLHCWQFCNRCRRCLATWLSGFFKKKN
jgi:hypothetical protein